MKRRIGFVSNSSSASFVVALSVLNDLEKEKILGYTSNDEFTDSWEIYLMEEKGIIRGVTIIDNGDLERYLGTELLYKLTIDSTE